MIKNAAIILPEFILVEPSLPIAAQRRGMTQLLKHRKFDVEIERTASVAGLGWPEPGEASDDSGLGCNRLYADFRRATWTEARRAYKLEVELFARLEAVEEVEEEYEKIEDELFEDLDGGLWGLDIGVASAVIALSAARCIPFSSCNGGAFGTRHQESYPLVVFFARPQVVEALLDAANEAQVGLVNQDNFLSVYANDIRNMMRFSKSLFDRSGQFRALKFSVRQPRKRADIASDQLKLF